MACFMHRSSHVRVVANGYLNGFGPLFYVTTIACQFPALHRTAYEQSAEWATLIRADRKWQPIVVRQNYQSLLYALSNRGTVQHSVAVIRTTDRAAGNRNSDLRQRAAGRLQGGPS